MSCAESSTAPLGPTELDFIESSTSADEKNLGKIPEGEPIVSFSRSSLSPSLSASAAADAPSYSVSRFSPAPESRLGLQQLPGSDDFTYGGTAGLDIGFNFTFFGQTYNRFFLSSNGLLFFDFIEDGAGVAQSIPLNDAPTAKIPRPRNNLIAFLWSDFVALPGQISYGVRGTAPNRRLIIDYNQVGFFACAGCQPTAQKATVQAILYEGSNVIEIHTTSMVNPGRFVTQGIENRFGTEAFFVQGRVRAGYHLSNDGVRFTPPAAKNAAPVALAGGNAGSEPNKHYEGVEGVAVEFKGSGVDADGDALTYSWDFNSDGVTDATTAVASFTYADNGPHSALLKVSDGRDVAEARVDVVIANADPVVNEGSDVRIKAGETVSFSGKFSDKGAKDALWSWKRDFGSLGSYSNEAENQADAILGSKKFCKAGVFPVKLTVVDKDGGSGSDELVVTVDALPIEIEVSPNSINTSSNGHGMISVRIFSRDGLDATALRPEAIKLTNGNGSGTPLARTGDGFHWDASTDLNGDGRLDVLAGFRRDELIANGDLAPGANQLKLSGEVGSCGDVVGGALVYAKEKGR